MTIAFLSLREQHFKINLVFHYLKIKVFFYIYGSTKNFKINAVFPSVPCTGKGLFRLLKYSYTKISFFFWNRTTVHWKVLWETQNGSSIVL